MDHKTQALHVLRDMIDLHDPADPDIPRADLCIQDSFAVLTLTRGDVVLDQWRVELTPIPSDDMEYCWYREDTCEDVIGPFASIEACKADIREGYRLLLEQPDYNPVIIIAEACPIEVKDYAGSLADAGCLLEQLEEYLSDDTCFDEPVFYIDKPEEAQIALDAALAEWAAKYVSTSGEWRAGKTIEGGKLRDLLNAKEPV